MLYVHICFNSPRALCSGPYLTLSVDKYVSRREDPMLEFIPWGILFNWGLIMNIYIRYIKNRHKPIFEENTVEYHTFLYLKTANMAGFADIWSEIFFFLAFVGRFLVSRTTLIELTSLRLRLQDTTSGINLPQCPPFTRTALRIHSLIELSSSIM